MPSIEELVSRNDKSLATHIPLSTFEESNAAGIGLPKVAIISCADPRVTPEKYFNLGPMDAIVFRNIAGHPQSCWKDIATLDAFLQKASNDSGFEKLIIVHHTGLFYSAPIRF
jgi:carbonic anhydrase